MTWRELAATYGIHHGQASSALSNLHRSGAIVRLAETRERCGVYVTPGNVYDRTWRAYRARKPAPTEKDVRDAVYGWAVSEGLNFAHPSIYRLVERLKAMIR